MTKEIGDSTLIDTWAATGTITEPDISKKNQGWTLGERPPFEFMNWLQNIFGKKINHMLSRGVADWDTATPYAIGATVNRTGSVWVALSANAASEPTGANTNWSQIATTDSVNAQVLDEDDFASNSATRPPSQQSVKAYVDSAVIPAAGAVGSTVFARGSADVAFGGTTAGSNLTPTSAYWGIPSDAQGQSFPVGAALSGTWRCDGQYTHLFSNLGNNQGATLWTRIA